MTERRIGIGGIPEVDASSFLETLRQSGLIEPGARQGEQSPEEAAMLEEHRAKKGTLIEAFAKADKEKVRIVLSRLMPSAKVTTRGDEFEIEFRDDAGSNQILTVKVTDSTLAQREAGFDLTSFEPPEKAIEAWNELGLDTRPIYAKDRCFVWAGDGLEIVAANNPFVGPPIKVGETALGHSGYASYMGIRGKKTRVAQAIRVIKKYGNYKEFEDGVLSFIGFPEA